MSVEGNKNAEKWTVEKAREFAENAYNAVDEECFFISSIAVKIDSYRDQFAYLMKKFKDDEVVFRTLKRMYGKAESILWEKSSKGEIDKTIAIFALKSLHGLFETSKHEVETTDKTPSKLSWRKSTK